MRRMISAGASALLAAMFCACAGNGGGAAPSPGVPPTVQDARRVPMAAPANAVQDGGFESDTYTYWKQGGTSSASLQTSVVHTGSYAAKMGGTTTEPNGTAGVYQTVTVPAGGTLTFWIDELTNETSTKYADQEADIRDTSGNVLKNLYTEVVNNGTSMRWKLETLLNGAAHGADPILDSQTKTRAEGLNRTRQRIHAGRMLSEHPTGPPDLRPEEAREAKAVPNKSYAASSTGSRCRGPNEFGKATNSRGRRSLQLCKVSILHV